MDEPDAYLSSQGQQDLLRIFSAFAYPIDDRAPCQVVYVTHSPFLIDKNHGERIRVLEKGEQDEGSRVVRDVSRNHYEPLRSAFGGFVGETTFMSNCNLMLEGLSDQIILAGMSASLRKQNLPTTSNIDLNSVTLVPTGSASHIPYMVYLARGRDVERPAVIVLLDGDEAGKAARKVLSKGGPSGKRLLKESYVLQLTDLPSEGLLLDNPNGPLAIEDLIPIGIGLTAVKDYVAEYIGGDATGKIAAMTPNDISMAPSSNTHSALEAAARLLLGADFHLDKVGVARHVVRIVSERRISTFVDVAAFDGLEKNFTALFQQLGKMQREAIRDNQVEKTGSRINRARRSFLRDHPHGVAREYGSLLLEEIDGSLDASIDAEEFRSQLRRLRVRFELDEDVTSEITEFAAFKEALMALVYQERRQTQEGI